ncbi:hypothetical protein [Pelagicoccus albus]|uniref:Haem-NO-binding n=1 Tax=Pelagicoccus albus TaxID=415222 RepID=A0A7X1E9D9_9BACT|nr:hypothetical protein [Pelagicoccus albus]MBC2607236.1 hypothetical protein [Pelagicoccus albus]
MRFPVEGCPKFLTFLEFAFANFDEGERAKLLEEFGARGEGPLSGVEFDLALWSVAQRLRMDTEELLRQVGERWFRASRFRKESWGQESESNPWAMVLEVCSEFGELDDLPLPGGETFQVEKVSQSEESLRLACEGPRRCCSFLEGVVRAVFEELGLSLRYIRQPKRATFAHINFYIIPAS